MSRRTWGATRWEVVGLHQSAVDFSPFRLPWQAKELQRMRLALESSHGGEVVHPLALEGKAATASSFNVDAVAAKNKER